MSGEIGGVCLADDIDAATDAAIDTLPIDGPSATGWAHLFSSVGFDVANALAADSSGNVYVVGSFSDNATLAGMPVASGGGTDAYVVKISPTGQTLWVRRYGGTGGDTGLAITVRTDGVLVGGSFSGTADFGTGAVTATGLADAFLLALTSDGTTSWVVHGGGAGGDARVKAVAVDSAQNIMVAGEFSGTVDMGGSLLTSSGANDLVVAKYAPDGAHLWSRRFGGSGGENSAGAAILAGGDIVVAGTFNGTIDFGGGVLTAAGGNDVFVARLLSTTGAHVWSHPFGSTNADSVKSIAATATGFAIAGCFTATASFGSAPHTSAGGFDGFVAGFDANGDGIWSKSIGGSASECAQAIAVKPTGNVLTTGPFSGSMTVGATTLISAGTEDIWLVEFSGVDGAFLTARRGGGTASDAPTAITAIGASFALAGNTLGTSDMFGQPLATGGLMDGFVVQSLQ